MPTIIRMAREPQGRTPPAGGHRPIHAVRARSRWTGPLGLGVLLAVLGPAGSPLRGQSETASRPRDRYWINGGLGFGRSQGSTLGFTGIAGNLSASYQSGAKLLSVRTAGVWEFLGGDAVGDVALLVGLATRQNGAHASLALGPGIAGGEMGGWLSESRTHFSSTLGLAVQVQGFGIAWGALGLGLYGFANFNAHHSFAGLTLALQFGELH